MRDGLRERNPVPQSAADDCAQRYHRQRTPRTAKQSQIYCAMANSAYSAYSGSPITSSGTFLSSNSFLQHANSFSSAVCAVHPRNTDGLPSPLCNMRTVECMVVLGFRYSASSIIETLACSSSGYRVRKSVELARSAAKSGRVGNKGVLIQTQTPRPHRMLTMVCYML